MDNIKSNLYSKNNTSEIKNKKEEELQKLQSVINQLKNTLCVKKDSFSINNISQYSIRSKSQGKSFNRRSISQTKEDKNDKDFFCDLLYNDDNEILDYKKIRLLSEEEMKENISKNEKYKNLAELMFMFEDDDNVTEKKFIRNFNNNCNKDKMILNLYSSLGRKSKDLFLEENYEKRKQLQSYFRRINDIKLLRIDNKKYIFDSLEPKNETNNNINYNNNVNEKEDENDLGEDEICDFMNNTNVPEFSADFLSYINHGFIDIEDIYNTNYNINKLNNENKDNSEKKIIPKEAIEINVSIDKDQIKKEKINKFIEFNDKCPKEININIKKDKKFIEQMERNKIFQNEIYKRISDISEYDENLFPIKGINIENKHIYFFAKNNKINEIIKEESFMLERNKIDKKMLNNKIINNLKEEEEFELNNNRINIEGHIDDNFDEEFFSIEEKNKFKNDNNIEYEEEEHSSNIEMRNYKINKIYS